MVFVLVLFCFVVCLFLNKSKKKENFQFVIFVWTQKCFISNSKTHKQLFYLHLLHIWSKANSIAFLYEANQFSFQFKAKRHKSSVVIKKFFFSCFNFVFYSLKHFFFLLSLRKVKWKKCRISLFECKCW